jgi:hypothetical protein
MKKAETISFRPFFSSRYRLNSGDSGPVLNMRLALALPRRLGLVDRSLMIPAAAAVGFVDTWRSKIAYGFGFVITTPAES